MMSSRLVLSLAAGLFMVSTASAHRMDAEVTFPESDPEGIRIVAGYDTDEPAQEATVTLLDAAGNVTAEGTTDDRGICRLPRPGPGKYTLIVNDGVGHRCERSIELYGEPTVIPDGPRNRWLMSALGLSIIAGASLLFAWWKRRTAARSSPPT